MGLKDFLKGEEAEAAADDAIARRDAAQKHYDQLDGKGIALLREQSELEERIGHTADDAKAKKMLARVAEIKSEREINDARKKVVAKECEQAELDLRKARTVNRVKVIRKHTGTRAKAAEKIQNAIAELYEGWSDFHAANEKLVLFSGAELAANSGYGGTSLGRDELRHKVEQELTRVSSPPPLDGKAVPALPGASLLGMNNPRTLPTLISEVEKANQYILRKAEQLPTPTVVPQKKTAPVTVVETAVEEVSAPSGPTINAAQVMATLGRRRME